MSEPTRPSVDHTGEELDQLRAQVAELQAQLAHTSGDGSTAVLANGHPGRRGGWWRPVVVTVLVAVAVVLAPLSVVGAWAHDVVSDTDRYVEVVSPLASDPAVQDAAVERITNEIFSRLDIEALAQQTVDALADRGLPPAVETGLNSLAGPLANGVRNFVSEQVGNLIRSPEFEQAWIEANRAAHGQLVAVLTGEGSDTIIVEGNAVSVNLAAVIEVVKQRLVDAGFERVAALPPINVQFTVFESADLARAQSAFNVLSAVARWLPILALLALAGAVYVSRNRRRTLIIAALALAASMLLLGATLNIFRDVYLNAIPPERSLEAAAAIYDTLMDFIRLNLRAVLVVALAVAAGAWLSGPSAAAVGARDGLSRSFAAVRNRSEDAGMTTGPVGAFAYRYRMALRTAIIAAAVLIYVLAEHPTGGWTLGLVAIMAVALLLVELIARPPSGRSIGDVDGTTAGTASVG